MQTAGAADQKSERRARSLRFALQSLAAVAVVFLASASRAQTSPSVELDFTSEPPCPDRVAFMRWVEARVGRSIQWQGGNFAFDVDVLRKGDEFHGHLRSRSGQYVTERDLSGKNCADVVAGLALVAALALDPNASTAPQPVPIEPQPAPQAPPKPPPQAQPKPPAPPTAPPVPPPMVPPPAPESEVPATYALSILGTLGVDSGPAPVSLIALGPKVVAELFSPSPWQPSFGLGFAYARTGFLGPEDASADFRWLVVRLSGCPLGAEIVKGGRLRGCGLADIGSMSAEGRDGVIDVTETTNQLWVATGLGPTFSYHPVSPLYVELGAGALLSWNRPTYQFEQPTSEIHEVPVLAFSAHIGLGVSFSDQ
jgi:hypothetical protein